MAAENYSLDTNELEECAPETLKIPDRGRDSDLSYYSADYTRSPVHQRFVIPPLCPSPNALHSAIAFGELPGITPEKGVSAPACPINCKD